MHLIDTGDILKGRSSTDGYDLFRFICCLQGVLNRDTPRLFVRWTESDDFWLEYITGEEKFLHGEVLTRLCGAEELLAAYAETIRACGLAIWDENVPATLNAATTACGVDNVLPIRCGAVLNWIQKITGAPVRLDLRGKFTGSGTIFETDEPSSGSAKCDAYIWALKRYMARTADDLLILSPDGAPWSEREPRYPDMGNALVPNMDYAVARRAFVFDLFCFADEAPCDDPAQNPGTDLAVMKRILSAQYQKSDGRKMTTVCGFNPWHIKYTTHGGHGSHAPVESEWHLSEILSAYNCVKDADAAGYCGLANASVYRFYPLRERYQNRAPHPPAAGYDRSRTYILFYVGDYDSAAWTARHIPLWYRDPALGKNPLMWCFNPNLAERIPMAFDFVYERFTENDYFAAGDSGAGYNNPRLLYEPRVHSELPSGAETNVAHNRYWMEKFDMSVIGFVINSVYPLDTRQMYDLARAAHTGVAYLGPGSPACIVGGVPFLPHTGDIAAERTDPAHAAAQALRMMESAPSDKRFHVFRTILVSPSGHDAIYRELRRLAPDRNIELLDPPTFFAYLKTAVENGDSF